MANENDTKTQDGSSDAATVPFDAAVMDQAGGAENGSGELRQLQDRLLRAQAELENYRKRARRELEEQQRYADLPLLRDLLPVVDNVSRAIAAAEKKADAASLLEGFKMVAQQLQNVLDRHHLKRISTLNEPFDPHRHEAVMQQPSAEHPEHTVIGEGQAGFELHDRVVRPAQVIVSTKPSGA